MRYLWATIAGLFIPQLALAGIHPECVDIDKPDDYDEQAQRDFLANYIALSTTFSPLHSPVPHEGGHGAIGVELAVIPPLSCARRYVFNHEKTEDTNKVPVVPKPRITFAFPSIGPLTIYGGAAYVPPLSIGGMRSVIVSGEAGFGLTFANVQAGGRFHATMHKTIGDVATKFERDDDDFDDLFLASTFGVDGMFGYKIGPMTPYLAVGFTDASTFFYIGDDSVVTNNYHPYLGPNFSVGIDSLWLGRIRAGAEFYGAPGGHGLPDATADVVGGFGRYGSLYTARVRLAVEL